MRNKRQHLNLEIRLQEEGQEHGRKDTSAVDEIIRAVQKHKEELEEIVKAEEPENDALGDSVAYGPEEVVYGIAGSGISIKYEGLFSYMGSGVATLEIAYNQQESRAEDTGNAPGFGVDMENETIGLIVKARKMDAMMGYGTSKLGGSVQYATGSHTISVSDMEKFQLLNKMAHIFALTLIKYEMGGW